VKSALASYELPVFEADTTQRVIYASSAATGRTVLDAGPDGPAAKEINAITRELGEFIHGTIRRPAKSKASA
jgi:chromosome partitioning protein